MNTRDCFVMTPAGWRHRPFFKVVANTILRAVQAWADTPLLIVSVTDMSGERPKLVGYRLARIEMRPKRSD